MATNQPSLDVNGKGSHSWHVDILDDHQDPMEHRHEDLNRYFTTPSIRPLVLKEEEMVVLPDETIDDRMDQDEMDEHEQHLSQQLTNLSVTGTKRRLSDSSSNEKSVAKKKKKVSDPSDFADTYNDHIILYEEKEDEIPNYLSVTNSFFESRIKKIFEGDRSASIDTLRDIAVAKHRALFFEQQKRLLLVYLRSGQGTLKENVGESMVIDLQYWPKAVTDLAMDKVDGKNVYEHFLQQRIQVMDEKIVSYKKKVDEWTRMCPEWTTIMEETIDGLIESGGMKWIRMHYDAQIGLVECEYDVAILERQYLHAQPNAYQLEMADDLYELRSDYEKARRILMELKQSISLHRVPKELHEAMLSVIYDLQSTASASSNRSEQLVRQKMTEYMGICINKAEHAFHQCRQRLHVAIEKVWREHHESQRQAADAPRMALMPKVLTDLIEKRFMKITDRWRIIYNYRMTARLDTSTKLIGYGPCLVMHTASFLTKAQLHLLNRGPTYVIPCQWLSAATSPASMTETMKYLYMPLKQQLTRLFAKHHVNIALSMDLQLKLSEQFHEQFAQPIPNAVRERSLMEKKVMRSTQHLLEQHQSEWILRRTNNDLNTFYLGDRKVFDEQVKMFLGKTDLFEFQLTINEEKYGTEWQEDIHGLIDSMNFMLRRVHEKKGINDELLKQLTVDASTIKLPYLYFLPELTQDQELHVVPIISAYQGPTWHLGRFLDRKLRLFVRRVLSDTRIEDENDFAQKFHHYCRTHRSFKSNTLFASVRITNYSAMVTYTMMVDAVEYMLRDHLPGNVLENVSIVHIKNLVQLFLFNNLFVYENKVYTCVKGSPTTIPLSETLTEMYLCQWQNLLLKELRARQQFFGR